MQLTSGKEPRERVFSISEAAKRFRNKGDKMVEVKSAISLLKPLGVEGPFLER